MAGCRAVPRAAAGVLVGLLAAVLVVRAAGLDRWHAAVLLALVTFVPYLALAALLITLVLAGLRWWRLALVALLVTAGYAIVVLPRWVARPEPAHGTSLRVMSANLRFGEADPAALVARVRRERPDLLSVQELTPAEARRLAAAGIGRYLPYRVLRARPGAFGTGLYARTRLTHGRTYADPTVFNLARADLHVGGHRLDVIAVHVSYPLSGGAPDWRAEIAGLPGPDTPGRQLFVGDFNAGLDHHAFRALLARGYRDAAASVGAGLTPTWRDWPEPPLTLDHVVCDHGIVPRSAHATDLPGTDHRILLADLSIT